MQESAESLLECGELPSPIRYGVPDRMPYLCMEYLCNTNQSLHSRKWDTGGANTYSMVLSCEISVKTEGHFDNKVTILPLVSSASTKHCT